MAISTTLSLTKPLVASASGDTGGTAGNDYLIGTSASELIVGGVIPVTPFTIDYSADGIDTMEGGMGDDWYIVNDTTDVITEVAGEGIDTVFTRVSYTLAVEVENIVATGTVVVTLTGNTKDNILDGSQTTALAETLVGGTGNDTYYISSTDKITEIGGVDTIIATSAVNLTATTNFKDASSAAGIENVTLTGLADLDITGNGLNNRLSGNTGSNSITGGAGNDILDSGAGGAADVLDGGAGNDTYIVRSGSTSTFADSAGTDTVKSYATTVNVSGASIENIILMGTANANATANASNNVMTGNSADNSLTGNEGNDTLTGGAATTLNTLTGGAGNDLYIVTDSGDSIVEIEGEGTDTVQFGGTDTAGTLTISGGNVEIVTLTGTAALKASVASTTSVTNTTMTGNSAANTLTGGDGNDKLDGGVGNDELNGGVGNDTLTGGAANAAAAGTGNALVGGTGNDLYVVTDTDDTITEGVDSGTDTVQFGGTTGTLAAGANVEIVTLTGSANISASVSGTVKATMTGNSGNNTLTGNNGGDVLNGGTGNDTLTGGSGNDTLQGGTGADNMDGGNGANYFYVDNSGDVVTGGTGTDTVESNISSYTLTAAAEKLTLAGTALDGTGNALANTINGNASNNTLLGEAAADTISGGSGNDTITGGLGNDSLTGGAGVDNFQMVTAIANGTDRITDFSRGASGDMFSISRLATGIDLLVDGISASVTAGATVGVNSITAATTLAGGDNIIVLAGTTFGNTGAVETAIEVGGSRELTFAAATAAGEDVIVVWSDGSLGHISVANITSTATTITAAASGVTDLVTLTGISSMIAGSFVAANFEFIA